MISICYGVKPKSIRCVFAVLQLSKHQHSGYLVEFVDHLTGLASNTSKSS